MSYAKRQNVIYPHQFHRIDVRKLVEARTSKFVGKAPTDDVFARIAFVVREAVCEVARDNNVTNPGWRVEVHSRRDDANSLAVVFRDHDGKLRKLCELEDELTRLACMN